MKPYPLTKQKPGPSIWAHHSVIELNYALLQSCQPTRRKKGENAKQTIRKNKMSREEEPSQLSLSGSGSRASGLFLEEGSSRATTLKEGSSFGTSLAASSFV
jgi:hypothetical protein